jgi:ribonuclease VapC
MDSSAPLALIEEEPGSDIVAGYIGEAAISSVNLAEVASKLTDRNFTALELQSMLVGPALQVFPFDEPQAIQAGLRRAATRNRGLSLGDRACLALARHLHLPVVTSDGAWKDLDVGVEVLLIR